MRKFVPTHKLILNLLFVVSLAGCASKPAAGGATACANDLDSRIQNFCVVTPNVLWRGAKPDQRGAAWLMKHGVRTIVNLELVLDDKAAFAQAVTPNVNHYEVEYFRLHDWEPLPVIAPSVVDDHVAHFLAIVSQAPKPIYVHCRSGMNRTGLMVATYRVLVEGVSDERAIEEMRRYDGQWFKADAKYIRELGPERREAIRRKAIEWRPNLKTDARIICANGECVVSDR
jgi:protein tyrosine phosphatase (PTP) superfamily phosphohydrolase (DUF442 family)